MSPPEREASEACGPKGTCPCDDPSEAFQLYDDGHGYCHAGGCPHPYWSPSKLREAGWEVEGEDDPSSWSARQPRPKMPEEITALLSTSEVRALRNWNISQATTRHWDYRTRLNAHGEGEHLAVYRDETGQVVDIKVRNTGKDGAEKRFFWASGSAPKGLLYGIHLLPQKGKMLVIAMGEKDALTISQLWANKFPVVSPSGGEAAAKKDVAANLERILQFEKIVLVPHADPAGFKAMEEVARTLPPGRAFIARLPLNDANDMHMAGRDQELISLIHNAPAHRPDGIVSLASLAGEMLSPTVTGRAYPWPFLTEWTYGRRDGEIIVLAAGTGIGKSDFMLQVAAHNAEVLLKGGNFLPTAVFNYEAGPQITGKAIAGKLIERRLHIPDPEHVYWTEAELREAVRYASEECAKIFINDHQGATDWGSVKERIRYLKHTEDIADAFVDPMAALVATEEDERKALDRLMAEAKMLGEELQLGLWFNTHVTRPSEGKSHEEGGRVTLKHLRGSNAIGMWASYVFALERDQQSDDEEERGLTTLRCLKDRFTGDATGKTKLLRYNTITGMLEVAKLTLEDLDEDHVEPPPL